MSTMADIVPYIEHMGGTDIVNITKSKGGSAGPLGKQPPYSPDSHLINFGLGPNVASPVPYFGTGPSDPTVTPSPFTEVGVTGLPQYGGFVRDEFLQQLQGDRALKIYREMWDNDAIVGAIIFAIQMLLRKVEWRVEPPEAATVEQIVIDRELRHQREAAAAHAQMTAEAAKTNPANTNPSNSPSSGNTPSLASPTKPPFPATGHPPITPQSTDLNIDPKPLSKPTVPTPQHALNGNPGLPQPGSALKPIVKSLIEGIIDEYIMTKAAAGGQGIGGIQALSPDSTDPATGQPLEFPPGKGPLSDQQAAQRKAVYLAVFTETCLHDMDVPWADLISQIITMIVFGFSYHEIVYKKRSGPNIDNPVMGSKFNDGKIGWAKISGRAQETRHRWEFDVNGNVLGMWQLAPPHFQLKYIPMSKALLFRTTAYKNNPEGRSALRSAYRSWYFKRRMEEIEAIGVERDLAGLPIAHVPYQIMTPSATAEEQASLEAIQQLVRNVRVDEQTGIVFPTLIDPDTKQPLYKFELLASPSRNRHDTNAIIQRYEQRIAMTCLADFILLGHDAVGARSLGETKADLFTTALEAWLNVMADVFNTYAIPRLMQINGESPAQSPKLTFGKLTRVSLSEMSTFITALAQAGDNIFPDATLSDWLRQAAGLPSGASSVTY